MLVLMRIWQLPVFRYPRRSQWVDATLAQGPVIRVQEADFVRWLEFKQNKSPV
jgi:hypothetical protein